MLGKIEGRRKKWWQKMRWVGVITHSNGHESEKLWGIVKDRETWHAAVHGVAKCWTQLSDWTTKILISLYLSSLLRKVLLSWLALPLDLFPLYPPPCRKIPFPNMNTYSDLLPYRLCLLLDWNTKYSTPQSFSWEGCWAQGEGHGSQDVSGREAVRPWDIGLEAVTSSSFRTAIITSLEVAMTGPAWGANDLSEKLFLSWQLPKPIVSLLWVSPKRPLMCLREAHNFSWWRLFWND